MKSFLILNIFALAYFAIIPQIICDNTCPSSSPFFLTVSDYEKYAAENLPRGLRDYLVRGAGDDLTLHGNTKDFAKFKVVPRYLRDISNRTTKLEILGRQLSMPIGIAPSGLHRRWHVNGENDTARAAASSGAVMILSVASSILIEEVAAAAGPDADLWLMTFIYEDRNLTAEHMERAKAAGMRAVVITVDMPAGVKALRYFNTRNQFKDNHKMVNYIGYEGRSHRAEPTSWDDIKMVVGWNILPVIIKGILTPEDALLAKEAGARGIIVSNHGGRQLDGAISSIEALRMIGEKHPELVANKGTDNNFDIYLDSGIRSGLDVFRALALGAKYVFVGRAPMWGLFHSGQQGVEAVLEILRQELYTVMGQAGCQNVACLEPVLLKYYP